jgi:hypothetical protein
MANDRLHECIRAFEGLGMASTRHVRASAALIMPALGLCTAASAVEFVGGTGEPNDPYQIATAEQLIAIGLDPNLPGKHFVLIADIDLSGVTLSHPVIAAFYGTFDGNNHTIRNLSITGIDNQGLFGYVVDGRVKSLGVVDVDVVSTGNAGALAAQNKGTVHNCYSTGSVVGMGYAVGGLVGYNEGTVADSYSAARVMGSQRVGGVVGVNDRVVSGCHGTGSVIGNTSVGGLVGENACAISACYSTADVLGAANAGGLVGYSKNRISCCYSTGNVRGASGTGGLVGYNVGRVVSCYSTATVAGRETSPPNPTVGRLVGGGYGSAGVENSYFLTPADRRSSNGFGTPLTAVQMMLQRSYTNWDFWRTGLDDKDTWFMPPDAFPVLAWQTEITGLQTVPDVAGLSAEQARAVLTAAGFVPGDTTYDFYQALPVGCVIHAEPHSIAPTGQTIGLVLSSGGTYDWAANLGDGTAANPYQVQAAGQLESLADHPELWDKCFVLTTDVEMAGRTYSKALIAPDTNDVKSDFQGTAFTGTFDGQGHAICNLTIRANGRGYVGLFGMIGWAGRVSDLHVVDAGITASGRRNYHGVLAGYNDGTLVDCSATGILVTASNNDGNGLTGSGFGKQTNCRADVAIFKVWLGP